MLFSDNKSALKLHNKRNASDAENLSADMKERFLLFMTWNIKSIRCCVREMEFVQFNFDIIVDPYENKNFSIAPHTSFN